jgi:hypothetical protein
VRSGWRGEIFLSGEKGTLGDFLWQIGGFGGHRRAWRGKRPPKFSGKSLWREGTEVVASQYFLVNQTPAKYGVASQNLAWLFVAGIQTAPKFQSTTFTAISLVLQEQEYKVRRLRVLSPNTIEYRLMCSSREIEV